jgi:hypothetical protein
MTPKQHQKVTEMTDEQKGGEIMAHSDESPSVRAENRDIVLGDSNVLKTAGLSEPQIQELQMHHAKGMIDINKKAQELHIDVKALDATLNTMAKNTEELSKAGDSVTITHSQDSSLGRTEVMMGNTTKAAKGKLSRSQIGEGDSPPKYIIIIAVVAIILALIMAN